jgi:hypothetical protein
MIFLMQAGVVLNLYIFFPAGSYIVTDTVLVSSRIEKCILTTFNICSEIKIEALLTESYPSFQKAVLWLGNAGHRLLQRDQ